MTRDSKTVTRRGFARSVARAGAVAGAPLLAGGSALAQATPAATTPAAGAPVPIDRIRFAGIGIGPRGMYDLQRLILDDRVQFVAIADVKESVRESVKSYVDNIYGNKECEMIHDVAELLPRKDIDALLTATSDRWHGPMAMWAAQSGKDMYSEKPAAMSIMESYALAENVRRYGVIYQSGCQRKNQFAFEFAVGLARTGKLGRLLAVHADTSIGLGTVDEGGHSWWPEDPEPDPRVIDWDKWLGPCLWRPYNTNYPTRGRGQFWDFHAGLLEWASHTVAMAQWAADMEYTEPVEYSPEGGEFRGDGLIKRYTIRCRYANGVQLILRNHSWMGLGSCSNRFEGTEGWVETGDSGRIELSDNLKSLLPARRGKKSDPTADHIKEFLGCIRSRTQPRANAEVTAHTHVTAHAAWISAQLNRKLTWNPAKRMFIGDEEANRMRSRAYREPWRMEALATSM